MKDFYHFLFVVFVTYLLIASSANAQHTPKTHINKTYMDDIVCLPVVENNNNVFKCMKNNHHWIFCTINDDLQLTCEQ